MKKFCASAMAALDIKDIKMHFFLFFKNIFVKSNAKKKKKKKAIV
jgi:hypothetical protein